MSVRYHADDDRNDGSAPHQRKNRTTTDADPGMNAALNRGISIAITESHDAKHDGRDTKEESDDRKPAEDSQIIRNQRFRILVRNDAPGGITLIGIDREFRSSGRWCFVGIRPRILATYWAHRGIVLNFFPTCETLHCPVPVKDP